MMYMVSEGFKKGKIKLYERDGGEIDKREPICMR
jgi:hypothetical protein